MTEARITASTRNIVGEINPRLFGSFVEHLGRCVYEGIFEPGHPTADAAGFRQDVLDLVRELGVTTIRYPGGNFVSGYRWEDGVGPREHRPTRIDLAWHSTESNQIGLHEFVDWSRQAGTEVMLAINLGTRGVLEALDLVEYTNRSTGTSRAAERAINGSVEPFGVTMWCLGNEMDGPWQLGHRSADDYGKLAAQTARALKQFDPGFELVVCGSSSAHMPTFGAWERTVLEHTYDDVEYISCHAYYEELDGDTASFLASAVDMDHFIDTVVATADHVKALKKSNKIINISFDEWNIWYNTRFEQQEKITDPDNWPVAPRLLEDSYSVLDAVVFGGLIISLLNHADRVKAASLAQLVNVIAPIMTEPGGIAWRQTTFHPFALAAHLARGTVLRTQIDGGTVPTARYGEVAAVDAVVTHDANAASWTVLVLHRGLHQPIEVVIDLGESDLEIVQATLLADDDLAAANTLQHPNRVAMRELPAVITGTHITVTLPCASWAALHLRRRDSGAE